MWLAHKDGIGLARLKERSLCEAKITPECRDWLCLSAEDGHWSVTSSSVAVLTTSCWESTSSVNLSCCFRAVFRSICLIQSKEALYSTPLNGFLLDEPPERVTSSIPPIITYPLPDVCAFRTIRKALL
jgi:hypothetical protein